jgi:hypothetical protein
MFISLIASRSDGFKKWTDNYRPSNDDEGPGEATPIALAGTTFGTTFRDNDAPQEPPHRPWVIPGVGGAF